MPTHDNLFLARGRLLARYGTIWKAASAYRSGYSANWLGRRLKGSVPIEPELAVWLAQQTGIDAAALLPEPTPAALITTIPAAANAAADDLQLERITL